MPERTYAYRNYVRRLSVQFEAVLAGLAAVYGFDYGPDFEIAVCQILRRIIPRRYGICRGHAVDLAGNEAGDDIIIFDASVFPTLRILSDEDYARRE
jgi:hypothetical protein